MAIKRLCFTVVHCWRILYSVCGFPARKRGWRNDYMYIVLCCSRVVKTAVFNFRHGRLSRLLSVSCVPMATPSTTASAAGDMVRLVRLVVGGGRWQVDGGRRATLGGEVRLRVCGRDDVGVATRDNVSPDRDMDRTAPQDRLRVVGRRRPGVGEAAARRRQDGLLPARIDVQRELSGRRTLGKVPRAGRRRRRVSSENGGPTLTY